MSHWFVCFNPSHIIPYHPTHFTLEKYQQRLLLGLAQTVSPLVVHCYNLTIFIVAPQKYSLAALAQDLVGSPALFLYLESQRSSANERGCPNKDSTCQDNSLTSGCTANLILLLIRDRKRIVIEMHCNQFVNVSTHYQSLLCYYAININYHIEVI